MSLGNHSRCGTGEDGVRIREKTTTSCGAQTRRDGSLATVGANIATGV